MSWEKVSLRSISEFIRTGKTPPSQQKEYFDGRIFWYTPGDLDNGKQLGSSQRTLTIKAIEDKKTVFFPSGTLLVACIGDIGKLGITTAKYSSSNQQITGIKPRPSVDVNYLFYWFKKNKKLLQHHSNSAVVPIINNKSIEKIKIPLPPLEDQKKIAAILDTADALRQKDKALIAKYEELTQSLFLDMFGDPVTNPKGWEFCTIRDLVKEAKYGTSAKAEEEGDFPYLRMNNITYSGYMDYTNLKYINVSEKDKSKYLVRRGDVLFNRTNSKELVGKTGIVETTEPFVIAGYLIRVRTNELANPYYVWAHLNSKWAKTTLSNMCKSIVGMANINAQELQDIKILKVPIDLQNQFAEHVQQFEKQKQLAQQSLQKSEELFNSLLQRAFKGELTKALEPA